MNSIIDLRTYFSASNSRLLVMVDLQKKNYSELERDHACDLPRSLDNCLTAIRHARDLGMPIAFTRQASAAESAARSEQSGWIAGFEPKRSDMVFERTLPSCYSNQLFEDVVLRVGNFAIAGLVAERACLATVIDASHRGHHITFLQDASVSRGRRDADARAVHLVATKAIELFAEAASTRDWLVATSPRTPKGHHYG